MILYFHSAVHLGSVKEDHVRTLLWLVVAGPGALSLTKLVIIHLFVFNVIHNFYFLSTVSDTKGLKSRRCFSFWGASVMLKSGLGLLHFNSLLLHDDSRIVNFWVKQQQLKYGKVSIEDRMIMTAAKFSDRSFREFRMNLVKVQAT